MASKRAKLSVSHEDGKSEKLGTVTTKREVPPITDKSIIPEFEKPLVSLTVSNPFKKILYWLDQIRKHQTTTFAFKLSIPLIALPVLVFAAFQAGRGAGISFQKTHATPAPVVSPTPQLPIQISRAGTLKVAKGATQTRYLLQLRNGEIVNLQIPANIDLIKYANKQVLVTGVQDKATGVIMVNDIAEVEVFNTTVIPQPTPSPSPSALLSPSPVVSAPSTEPKLE